jgi:hypothetical protein
MDFKITRRNLLRTAAIPVLAGGLGIASSMAYQELDSYEKEKAAIADQYAIWLVGDYSRQELSHIGFVLKKFREKMDVFPVGTYMIKADLGPNTLGRTTGDPDDIKKYAPPHLAEEIARKRKVIFLNEMGKIKNTDDMLHNYPGLVAHELAHLIIGADPQTLQEINEGFQSIYDAQLEEKGIDTGCTGSGMRPTPKPDSFTPGSEPIIDGFVSRGARIQLRYYLAQKLDSCCEKSYLDLFRQLRKCNEQNDCSSVAGRIAQLKKICAHFLELGKTDKTARYDDIAETSGYWALGKNYADSDRIVAAKIGIVKDGIERLQERRKSRK